MVHHGRDRIRVHWDNALEIVGLDVLRSDLEGVACFLVQRAEVEELADTFSAPSGQVEVVLLQRIDASEEVLRVALGRFKFRVLALQFNDTVGLFSLGVLQSFDLASETHAFQINDMVGLFSLRVLKGLDLASEAHRHGDRSVRSRRSRCGHRRACIRSLLWAWEADRQTNS